MKTKITIASGEKFEKYKDADGRNAEARFQDAYIHEQGKPYPTSCKLPLYGDSRPFPEGEYETEQAVEVNQFNKLRVKSELELSRVAAGK